MRKVISSTTRLSGNKSLVDLVSTAVQPLRVLAFENNGPDKAAQMYPELQGAVSALRAAEAYSRSLPTPGRGKDYLDRARVDIQQTLNAGRLVEGPRVASRDRSLER